MCFQWKHTATKPHLEFYSASALCLNGLELTGDSIYLFTIMAYSNSTSDRMEELRFRSQQSPRTDSSLHGLVSPPRNTTRLPQPLHSQDSRAGLMRRFTTDSGRVPTVGTLANQRGVQEPQEYGPSVSNIFPYCPFWPNFLLS
jgi:hypothetical protein